MSIPGTKREFSPERLKGRKLPHCRRSALNVGLSAEERPDSERSRMHTNDPNAKFDLKAPSFQTGLLGKLMMVSTRL